MAVLINGPFGRNRVFQKTAGKPLPDWAKEIDATSWAQIALKYIISNPAVTCAIPGTMHGQVHHRQHGRRARPAARRSAPQENGGVRRRRS